MIGVCPHCSGLISLRNPSGFCDHLKYPENCEVCQKIEADAADADYAMAKGRADSEAEAKWLSDQAEDDRQWEDDPYWEEDEF